MASAFFVFFVIYSMLDGIWSYAWVFVKPESALQKKRPFGGGRFCESLNRNCSQQAVFKAV